MEEQKFMSDEVSAIIGKSWVMSVAPKIYAASASSPYKMMDQKKTAMQIRLMPYNNEKSGERVDFNLTWPQFDTLCSAVTAAQNGLVQEFNLAEACDDTFTRVFGAPDANGLCPARVLVIKREPVMKDGSKARLPWYVEIKNGRAQKIPTSTGGAYMKGSTFVEDSKCIARLSDGQMKNHCYWGSFLMDLFINATKGGVLAGHTKVEQKKTEYRQN